MSLISDYGNFANFEHYFPFLKALAIAVIIVWAVKHGIQYLHHKKIQKRRAAYKKNVVILHQFGRAKFTPSISPYCVKLETYLRLANIPYENDFKEPRGPLGKGPWITHNGRDVPDSRLCIEYLNKEFNINLNSHLSAEKIAIGHMIVLAIENHTSWIGAIHRWVYQDHNYLARLMSFHDVWPCPVYLIHNTIKKGIDSVSKSYGIGKHSQETLWKFAKEDLKQLSVYLGEKKFLFGDQISEYDCAIFGWISNFVWNSPDSKFEEWTNGEYKNLKSYALRMKELCWPDWESCLQK